MSQIGYVACAYFVASAAIIYMSLSAVMRMAKVQRELEARNREDGASDDEKR